MARRWQPRSFQPRMADYMMFSTRGPLSGRPWFDRLTERLSPRWQVILDYIRSPRHREMRAAVLQLYRRVSSYGA